MRGAAPLRSTRDERQASEAAYPCDAFEPPQQGAWGRIVDVVELYPPIAPLIGTAAVIDRPQMHVLFLIVERFDVITFGDPCPILLLIRWVLPVETITLNSLFVRAHGAHRRVVRCHCTISPGLRTSSATGVWIRN